MRNCVAQRLLALKKGCYLHASLASGWVRAKALSYIKDGVYAGVHYVNKKLDSCVEIVLLFNL